MKFVPFRDETFFITTRRDAPDAIELVGFTDFGHMSTDPED